MALVVVNAGTATAATKENEALKERLSKFAEIREERDQLRIDKAAVEEEFEAEKIITEEMITELETIDKELQEQKAATTRAKAEAKKEIENANAAKESIDNDSDVNVEIENAKKAMRSFASGFGTTKKKKHTGGFGGFAIGKNALTSAAAPATAARCERLR